MESIHRLFNELQKQIENEALAQKDGRSVYAFNYIAVQVDKIHHKYTDIEKAPIK